MTLISAHETARNSGQFRRLSPELTAALFTHLPWLQGRNFLFIAFY
jgi:hypothetical protein